MKRFKAQSQGDLQAVWNVLDTKTNFFKLFGATGRDARTKAIKLARKLNADKRYSK